MSIMDRYTEKYGGEVVIGNEIISDDAVIHQLLNKKIGGKKEGVPIRFYNDIPPEVSGRLKLCYKQNDEGYIIDADDDAINVYSLTARGLYFAANAVVRHAENGRIKKGIIYNYPSKPVRGAKVYIPAREDIEYFKEFIDFCAYYGYNTLVLEIGGAMQYERHPEINAAWEKYCAKFSEYRGQSLDYQNAPRWARNSIHMENGGGSFLTKEELCGLIEYVNERHIEIIPEVPTLSHSDYILAAYPELREREEDDLPDTYCPSEPQVYKIVFDILDEVIDLFRPKQINIGHDEYFSVALCEKCRHKDPAEIYANDIIKIKTYLDKYNIKTIMWSEMLLNAIGKQGQTWGGSHKYVLNMRTNEFLEERPATYRAIDMLPKDIIMFNWYWGISPSYEKLFNQKGFSCILSNFSPLVFENYNARQEYFDGIVISNWSSMNQEHMQRNGIFISMAYAAKMLWSGDFDENDFENNFIEAASDIFNYRLNGDKYLYITHFTDVYKSHPVFVDGFMIDKDDDYLGRYIIEYSDGSTDEIPLYYNLNIGTGKCDFTRTPCTDCEGISFPSQVKEATYSCEIVKCGEQIAYKLAIPVKKEVTAVKKVEDSKYGKNIIIEEVRIKDESGDNDNSGS